MKVDSGTAYGYLVAGLGRCGEVFQAMIHSRNQYKYAVRRLIRANDKIQNDKFCKSILKGGVNIFAEIRKFRGSSRTVSSRETLQITFLVSIVSYTTEQIRARLSLMFIITSF